MTPQALIPALVIPLVVFAVYRRMRRLFGRQPIQPKRKTARMVILSVLGAVLLFQTSDQAVLIGSAVGGLAFGAALAFLGLRLTRFESTPQGDFYTPNGYLGAILSAVLISRLLYRYLTVLPVAAAQGTPNPNPLAAFHDNPLTLTIFMVLIGYYVTYYAGVLRWARRHPAP